MCYDIESDIKNAEFNADSQSVENVS